MSWRTRIKRVNKAAARQIAKEYYHPPPHLVPRCHQIEVLPPACDYCNEPAEARVNVETAVQVFQELALCGYHFNRFRQRVAVERYTAQEDSEVA